MQEHLECPGLTSRGGSFPHTHPEFCTARAEGTVVDAEPSTDFLQTWGSWLLSEGSLSQLLINATTYDNFLKQVVILSRLLSELKKQWVESPFIPVLWSQVLLTRWNIITSDWTHFSWKQRKYVYLRLRMKNTVKNRKCSGIICS